MSRLNIQSRMLRWPTLPTGTRYHDALGSCQEVYFYANALNDNTVSYCSAALARRNPFGTMKDIPRLEAYPVISGLQRVCDDADLRVGFDHGQRPNNGESIGDGNGTRLW